MEPKVSIIIPVYNGSNYLKEAIESALAQTYKKIEIVVVNDGSNDDGATEKIALSYGDKIKYIAKENGGVSTALNEGIRQMSGEYFSWLSHDDLYLPNKIEKEVEMLESLNDIVLCDGKLMDFSGQPIKHHLIKKSGVFSGLELFKNYVNGYRLNGLGFLVPRKALMENGLFDESLRYLQDLDLWLKLCWNGYRFICLDDELVVSRIHKAQTTNVLSDRFRVDEDAVAENHYNSLVEKSANIDFFVYYYLLYVRSNCKKGIRLFKSYLVQRKKLTLRIRIKAIKYKIGCFLIFLIRKVRNAKYAKKKMRD